MTRFTLALALTACSSTPLQVPDDDELSGYRLSAVQMTSPGWHRAECSGVAVGPHEVLTAHHCAAARPDWYVLTYDAWLRGGDIVQVSRAQCWTWTCPFAACGVAVDGVCLYRSDERLPHWAPTGDTCRPGERPAVHVLHGGGREFSLETDWTWRARGQWLTTYDWARGDPIPPGASGAPTWCDGAVGAIVTHSSAVVRLPGPLLEMLE